MVKRKVLIDSVDKIKAFVAAMSALPCEAVLRSGRHIANAASIMGVFALDLSKPVDLEIRSTDEAALDLASGAVAAYAVG